MKLFQVPIGVFLAVLGVRTDALSNQFLRSQAEAEKNPVARRLTADSVDPATYAVTMNVGETTTFPKTVTIGAEAFSGKVDVFFLVDTTGTMNDEIVAIQTSAADILASASALGDVAFGVGEYKDFPHGDFNDPFAYRADQDITTDINAVETAINNLSAGGGGDFPEANLFALHEVATTASWRAGSTRILVWIGDIEGHDPSGGISLADAIASLQAESIVVQAIDLDRLDFLGQATSVTAATGGTLYGGVPLSSLVATIKKAIVDVLFSTYSSVRLHAPSSLAGVDVSFSPAEYTGHYSRKSVMTFDFDATVECLAVGVFGFDIKAKVDGGQVAVSSYSITCEPAPVDDRLGLCEADCDVNEDCAPGLLCADTQKDALEACGFDRRKVLCEEDGFDYRRKRDEVCFDPTDARLVVAGCDFS